MPDRSRLDSVIKGPNPQFTPQGLAKFLAFSLAFNPLSASLSDDEKEAPAGCYEIRSEELRATTENDRALHEARKLLLGASSLMAAGKYEEARPLKALGLEHLQVAAVLHNLGVLYMDMDD